MRSDSGQSPPSQRMGFIYAPSCDKRQPLIKATAAEAPPLVISYMNSWVLIDLKAPILSFINVHTGLTKAEDSHQTEIILDSTHRAGEQANSRCCTKIRTRRLWIPFPHPPSADILCFAFSTCEQGFT
ncbi:hypothetical protein O6H91_Y551200 [Diphasiastrum complanatum]|nr:hypothetical protein O6H91_Y551200 [Diphasiastrum complanatum]